MKVIISSEEQLVKISEEAIKIIANLRKFTKLWEANHGVFLKKRKKCWEEIADKFIERLQIEEGLKQNENIKIEINDQSIL